MSNDYEDVETSKTENPILKVLKWVLSVILVILLIILIIWLVRGKGTTNNNSLDPLLNQIFTENINIMKDAATDYYTVERVPSKEGQTIKLTLQEMLDLKLLLPLTDKNGDTCDINKSYTEITKVGSEYQLKVNLSCGDEEEYIIVYLGCHDYCKAYICEEKTETTPGKEETTKVSNPSCSLKIVSGSLGNSGNYVSNVVVGFKSKTAGTNATLTGSGVGLSKNYSNSTYTVTKNGTTTVYGYVKDSNGKTAVCSIKVTKEKEEVVTGNPSCSLKVTSGTLSSNGTYSSDVVIGFKETTAGTNSTLTGKGIGLSTNYTDNTYTVNKEGTTTVYGYVKNSSGKTATCNITITKEITPPSCSLKVTKGTLNSDGTYSSDVVIGFKSKTAGTNSTLTGFGVGLIENYTNSTYTVTKNGTTTVYGYVKDSNGKTAVCSINVVKDTKYEYLYEKKISAVYSDWSDWSANKVYTSSDNIVWGKQELIWNEKNGAVAKYQYVEDKNQPIWQVKYDRVVGYYTDYVCDGYTYYRNESTSTTYQIGDWVYSHTLYDASSVPNWTATTKYVYKGINYAICQNTCTSKPVYIVDVYTRSSVAKTKTSGELSAVCNVVTKDIPVYGTRPILVGYVSDKVLTGYTYYYHTKTRTLIKEAYTIQVWSDSKNDTNLINQGYTYTGTSREK